MADSTLQDLIADTLAEAVKSYNLPAVCERLGLAAGDQDEAFKSKRAYVKKRLAAAVPDGLLSFAEAVLREYPSYHLEEHVRKAQDESSGRLSPLTRQKISAYLSGIELSPKLPPWKVLQTIWPLHELPSEDLRCFSFADEISQHMVLNDDWDTAYLLARLGIDECSERRLLDLLEHLAHPLCREAADQDLYVDEINSILRTDGLELRPVSEMSAHPIYEIGSTERGVQGAAKNIIFSATGPKPEIVLPDALNNDLRIVKNEEHCLVYDRPLRNGLKWSELISWWAEREGQRAESIETERELFTRLKSSLSSEPERYLFDAYFRLLREPLGPALPALIPQVYLHYDPYTMKQLDERRLARQRIDFLILFSGFERVVIEVDGKQHYSDGDTASPRLYAEMVAADRDLRLAGYEMYRFGGYELSSGNRGRDDGAREFLEALMMKHSASLSISKLREGFLTGQGSKV